MNFTKPETVISPKASVSNLAVLLNTGENGWSLASLQWDDRDALAVRWNGHPGNPIGNPQSRGIPTWFILPDEIAALIRDKYLAEQLPREDLQLHMRLKLRPLPRRILRGKDQEQRDDVWVVSDASGKNDTVVISNISTDHFLVLHRAHIKDVTPDSMSEKEDNLKHGILNMAVQVVIEDGNVRLEPLS